MLNKLYNLYENGGLTEVLKKISPLTFLALIFEKMKNAPPLEFLENIGQPF